MGKGISVSQRSIYDPQIARWFRALSAAPRCVLSTPARGSGLWGLGHGRDAPSGVGRSRSRPFAHLGPLGPARTRPQRGSFPASISLRAPRAGGAAPPPTRGTGTAFPGVGASWEMAEARPQLNPSAPSPVWECQPRTLLPSCGSWVCAAGQLLVLSPLPPRCPASLERN